LSLEEHWALFEAECKKWDDVYEPEQEYQVAQALRKRGHTIHLVPMENDPQKLLTELGKHEIDVVFNCTEAFNNEDSLDYIVPALLETAGVCYTGASPLGLMLTRNKALSKQILTHHGIRVPAFESYQPGEKVPAKVDLPFPLIVKPLSTDASVGISQNSLVRDRDALSERVKFIHEKFEMAAIAEQFVEGRELQAAVLGNGKTLRVLPPTELIFDKKTPPDERIATHTAKWNEDYRKRKGIKNVLARPLSKVALEQLEHSAKTAFETLWLRDYARLDFRLDNDDQVWVIEANANPYLSLDHELSVAAVKAGMEWPELIERIAREAKNRCKS
jgi:D-alanine-D-alanine ligase